VNLTDGESVSGGGGGSGNSPSASSSSSSDSSSSSAQILVISKGSWLVNATVDASSVGLIKTGDQAELQIDGASGTVYGTIASIGLVSSSSGGTASYPVVVDVTGAQPTLHDGASVTATLIYKQLSDIVVVSSLAIHRDSNGSYVEKVVKGKTTNATVQTGLSSGGQTQITSGLEAGDTIVVPQLTIRSGGGTGTRRGTFTFPGGGSGNFPGAGTGNFQFPGGGTGGN